MTEYYFAQCDDVYYLRLCGALTHHDCAVLNNFIESLEDVACFEDIIVDLSNADSIDSTILGLLLKISRILQKKSKKSELTVYSPREHITSILREMGLHRLMRLIDQSCPCMDAFYEITDTCLCKENNREIILKSHERLSALNENNKEKFRNVIRFMNK